MIELAHRLIAYLINDARRAEALDSPKPGEPPQWLLDAVGDERQAEFAVDVATKSVELANAAVVSLQEKASKHLSFLMASVPLALAATAVSFPPPDSVGVLPFLGFALLTIADVLLLIALALASLASGMSLAGGISIERLGLLADRMGRDAPDNRRFALKVAEAESLRYAAQLAYTSGSRIAQDLYGARRFTFLSALFATVGVIVWLAISGGTTLHPTKTP